MRCRLIAPTVDRHTPARGRYPYEGSDSPRRRSGTDKTTALLLEAGATEFTERGYDAARVSSIARRARLTPGAVYARWQTKSEVLTAALDYILRAFLPSQILEEAGVEEAQPADMVAMLAAYLMRPAEWRHVMIHAFGSARNNSDIRESLQAFLNEEAGQFPDIVEAGKANGSFDPQIDTPALTFLCQAIGVGTEMLHDAGLDVRNVPSVEEWEALMARLIEAAAPRDRPDG